MCCLNKFPKKTLFLCAWFKTCQKYTVTRRLFYNYILQAVNSLGKKSLVHDFIPCFKMKDPKLFFSSVDYIRPHLSYYKLKQNS